MVSGGCVGRARCVCMVIALTLQSYLNLVPLTGSSLLGTESGGFWRSIVQIRVGFEMIYDCPQPIPMIFNLNVHASRASDIVGGGGLMIDTPVPMAAYRDSFDNWCTPMVA